MSCLSWVAQEERSIALSGSENNADIGTLLLHATRRLLGAHLLTPLLGAGNGHRATTGRKMMTIPSLKIFRWVISCLIRRRRSHTLRANDDGRPNAATSSRVLDAMVTTA